MKIKIFLVMFLVPLSLNAANTKKIESEEYVKLNVLGDHYEFPKSALFKYEGSFFEKLFDEKYEPQKDEKGRFLITYSKHGFEEVSHFLVTGKLLNNYSENVIESAAKYFQLKSMLAVLKKQRQKRVAKRDKQLAQKRKEKGEEFLMSDGRGRVITCCKDFSSARFRIVSTSSVFDCSSFLFCSNSGFSFSCR